ncbi:MAG: ABC transporter ATP-binding protein [Spirochaetes bacterium]|nr:ABC transporter ATP-binding protein [Spirochaetota bacterium]
MLKIRSLDAGYSNLKVLKRISMHVKAGEIVTIIGANGSGKSTLLHAVSGIIKGKSGEIIFKDKQINNYTAEKIVYLGCSLIPEGRQLFPAMTVKENLVLGGYILKSKNKKINLEEEIKKIYTLFPRLEERKNQLSGTLSGGEQQMLAIGRALMSRPDFIMMDEPSIGLAPLVVKEIFKTVVSLRKDGKTILLVEQNAKAALKIADRGYVMETGNIILEGTSEELLNNHDVQRAYLGKDYKNIAER